MKTRIEFWWLMFLNTTGLMALGWLYYQAHLTKGLAFMGLPMLAAPIGFACLLLLNLVSKRGDDLRSWERKLAAVLVALIVAPIAVIFLLGALLG